MAAPLYDAVVVGGGPAGLTAAIYLARARYRVLVVEKEAFGGQIKITAEVVNYPGIARTDGGALTDTMREQAQAFGAEFMLADVQGIEDQGEVKLVHTSRGDLEAFTVLIATGAHPRKVGFRGEDEYRGRGVAYCATCDGEFFTGRDLFVIGGGFAACEEAMFLTRYARKITMLVRRDRFACAESVVEHLREHKTIEVRFNTSLLEVEGESALTRAVLRNNVDGSTEEYKSADGESFGVFVFAGYQPSSQLAQGFADIDDHGYIIVDRDQATKTPGVYAAGDVCVKKLRQVVTAVADGAIAATSMERHAAAMQKATGRRPERPSDARPAPAQEKPAAAAAAAGGSFLSPEQCAQLAAVFARFQKPLKLRVELDDRAASADLKSMVSDMAAVSDKLSAEFVQGGDDAPVARVLLADGTDTGLAFHGAPGGHEFNGFIISLYNAAGPGQAVDAAAAQGIAALGPVEMKIMVSLSCTMCPELVMAAQRVAAGNPAVRAEVYDVNLFPALRAKYNIMSVPCLVIRKDGKEKVTFGKKNLAQLLELLQSL